MCLVDWTIESATVRRGISLNINMNVSPVQLS